MAAIAVEKVQCVVIGAGVVGLACARRISERGIETLIIEKASKIGSGTSSRNSEVIHAGLYYKPGSLKANFCVEGKEKLYHYLKERSLPHNRCGKFLIATSESEVDGLKSLQKRAVLNGVNDTVLLNEKEAREIEPAVTCVAALNSPSTGILDTHAFMSSLQGDAEAAGSLTVFDCEVTSGLVTNIDGYDGILLNTSQGQIFTNVVINCAGLYAIKVASVIIGYPFVGNVPNAYFAKGNYFKLENAKVPFRRLIYPVPEKGGLGIHATIDMAGSVRFGPDVEWLQEASDRAVGSYHHKWAIPDDFSVNPQRNARFYESIRKYWPDLPDGSLAPDYSGIRPKLGGPDDPTGDHDFRIEGYRQHGVRGLINLFGIESPGLTSSLAIADYVERLVEDSHTLSDISRPENKPEHFSRC